jgi:hypothetical protein
MVSVDWILTGKGKSPELTESDLPWSELQSWSKLLDTLNLPTEVAEALYELPFCVRRAGRLLPRYGVIEKNGNGVFAPGLKEALRLSVAAWTEFVRTWIKVAGIARTRESVIAHVRELQMGFSTGGQALIFEGELPEEVLDGHLKPVREGPLEERVNRLLRGTISHETELRARVKQAEPPKRRRRRRR